MPAFFGGALTHAISLRENSSRSTTGIDNGTTAVTEENETRTPQRPGKDDLTPENRPRRTLEDWEMLQSREEPPLKVPWWFIAMVIVMLTISVFLTLPLMGERKGFERPWFDWGLVIGVGYGVVFLVIIYFYMRGRKKARDKSKFETKK